MSFSRIRAPGGWIAGSTITPTELETFDQNLSRALDGYAGGTYAPSSLLEIGGSGLKLSSTGNQLSGTLTVLSGGLLAVNGGAAFVAVEGSTFLVQSDATLQGNVALGISGGTKTLTVHGAATFEKNVTVTQAATFNGAVSCTGNVTLGDAAGDAVTINGNLTVANAAALDGNVSIGSSSSNFCTVLAQTNFAAQATHSAPIVLASAGRVRKRIVHLGDANANITPQAADVYIMLAGVPTAARTFTIDDTNCADGDELIISCLDSVWGINVNDNLGALILTMLFSADAARSLHVVRSAGAWRLCEKT